MRLYFFSYSAQLADGRVIVGDTYHRMEFLSKPEIEHARAEIKGEICALYSTSVLKCVFTAIVEVLP